MLIMKLKNQKKQRKKIYWQTRFKDVYLLDFFKKQINNDAIVDEYLTLKKLNLKRK